MHLVWKIKITVILSQRPVHLNLPWTASGISENLGWIFMLGKRVEPEEEWGTVGLRRQWGLRGGYPQALLEPQ